MAYTVGGEHRRDVYYRARAVENSMFVVTSGLVGRCGGGEFGGGSVILDADALLATRSGHRMHADHRADLGPMRRV